MITMGIGFGAGVFYWLADYKLAFWILVYAIIYGALGALRDYNQTQSVYRQGSGSHHCDSDSSRLAYRRTCRLFLVTLVRIAQSEIRM